MTTPLCHTPVGGFEVVDSSNHFVHAATFELKYCMPNHSSVLQRSGNTNAQIYLTIECMSLISSLKKDVLFLSI